MDEQQRNEFDLYDECMASEVRQLTMDIKAELMKILVRYGINGNLSETNFQNVRELDVHPPAENSPKNIMNILNDDCLKAILTKIKDVVDFGNMALVCKRFMQNAIECFPFKRLIIKYPFDCHKRLKSEILVDDIDTFLSIFGHRIKHICSYYDFYIDTDELHSQTINLIAKYCGKTLSEFHVIGYGVMNLCTPMQALKTLRVTNLSIENFEFTFPELENFAWFSDEPVNLSDWIKNYPKLRNVNIGINDVCSNQIINDMHIKFQNLNSQLETLTIHGDNNVTSKIWEGMGDRLPNISKLTIHSIDYVFGPEIVEITTLMHLIELRLYGHAADSIKSLLSALIVAGQPIEKLALDICDIEIAEMLTNFKSLKYLRVCRASLFEMVTIIQKSKRLVELSNLYYNLGKMTFNLGMFQLIGTLAKGRLKVNFCYSNYESRRYGKVKILSQVSKEKNEWIRFIPYETAFDIYL